MRVAVASSGLGHIVRGIETWAADLAAALSDRDVDVTLFQGGGPAQAPYARVLRNLPREDPRNARWARLAPRGLDWRLNLSAGYPLEQTTFAWSLAKILRREKFDILHVQDPVVALWMERLRKLGWLKTRTILAHGTEEPPEFLKKFDFVQELSPSQMQSSVAAGVARPTWATIGNFVDVERFHPGSGAAERTALNIPQDAFVVLTVAAIKRHHKRIDWLVNAVAEFRKANPEIPVVLLVAGGREEETDSVIAEGNEKLGTAVRFLVRHPREKIPGLLRSANVFVLASLREMMPIALLEAGATGLPCVTNDDATMRWMTGQGGLPIDMTNSDALIERLATLYFNTDDRKLLAACAREHSVSTFSTPTVVEQIERYYTEVMKAA